MEVVTWCKAKMKASDVISIEIRFEDTLTAWLVGLGA